MRGLTGKVAVVTGAASGMGRAFAERFAQEGMKVVLADIEQPALDIAVQELRLAEHDVIGVQTDVMSRDAVRALADRAYEAYGGVHLLCNNAGIHGYIEGPIWEASANDWAWTMGVNFWGVVNGVETFLPRMLAFGEEGHIVNTASAVGFIQPQGMYYITKHTVVAYTELLHGELLAQGAPVHVSLLCPGSVSTRFSSSVRNRPESLKNPPDPVKDAFGEAYRARMASNQGRSMPAARAADILLEAVKNGEFYVFTDHEWDDKARVRFDGVLARENPPAANRSGPESRPSRS